MTDEEGLTGPIRGGWVGGWGWGEEREAEVTERKGAMTTIRTTMASSEGGRPQRGWRGGGGRKRQDGGGKGGKQKS